MGKKVIFHANHSASLYQFVVLKKKFYPTSNITLLINNVNLGNSDFAKRLVEEEVFSKIVTFCEPFNEYNGMTGESAIIGFYDDLFQSNGLTFENVSEVITACDIQNWFGLYCVFNNIYPDFLEMHDNQFINIHRYSGNRLTSDGPLWVEELSLLYHILDGENQKVNRRYLCKNSKVKFEEKDVIIDFIEEFYSLPSDLKNSIINAMNLGNVDYSNCNLLLLNSFGWTTARTDDPYPYHYLPYFLLADYYFDDVDGVVLLKDHPQTDCKYFSDVVSKRDGFISSIIPIEFLGLISNFRINKLLSINSTGNEKISRFVAVQKKVQDNYLFNYKYIHKLFVALMLETEFEKSLNFHTFGIDTEFIKNFIANSQFKCRYEDVKGLNPSILKWNIFAMIGKISESNISDIKSALRNADLETKVVFLGDEVINALSVDDYDIISNIVPIKIKKCKLFNDTLTDFHQEYVYFFCKSYGLRQTAQRFTASKDLIKTGISIYAGYDGDQEDVLRRAQMQSMILKMADLEKQICEASHKNMEDSML